MACQDLVELEKSTSEQISALKKELEEKSEALKDMENRYSSLIVKQVLTNQELQDARKESILVFTYFPSFPPMFPLRNRVFRSVKP